MITPNRSLRGITLIENIALRQDTKFRFRHDRRHNVLGYISEGSVLGFFPATPAGGCEFHDRVHGHFDIHAGFDRGTTKVGNQGLQDGNMADNEDGHDLLLHVDNDGLQTAG